MNRIVWVLGMLTTLMMWVPAADAGERGHLKKLGSQKVQGGRHDVQSQLARSEGRQRRVGEAVECGDVLSEAGNYALNSDLVCTSPINITGSNVHLDLAGHSISCDAENWIYADPASDSVRYPQIVTAVFVNASSAIEWELSGSDQDSLPQAPVLTGVEVQNGMISDCTFGIYAFKTDRSKVTNMQLIDNNVERPEFNYASTGITTFVSNDNDFVGNHVSGSGNDGFELVLSTRNRLRGNVLEGMGDDGIFLIGSSENVIQQNTVTGNPYGIYLQPDFFWGVDVSNGNVIALNTVSGNAADGITLLGPSDSNVIRSNTVSDNGGVGVLLLGLAPFGLPVPAGNTVRENVAGGNPTADLAEVDLDENFDPVIPAGCSNLWKHNTFDTAIGPEMCIE